MYLVETADNPMPPGAIAGTVQTPDGMSVRYARWRSLAHPVNGTVLLLHGRAEYIEKMYETVTNLRQMGFEVFTLDWRGQGGSTRMLSDPRRGYVDDFDQYIVDLETCMSEIVLPDCPGPYYILAHSTGSLVALLAAPQFGNRIRRMVLCAPLLHLAISEGSQRFLKFIAGTFTTIGLGEVFMHGGPTPDDSRSFAGNRLTSDLDRYMRNTGFIRERPELGVGGPTAAWLFAAFRAMDRVEDPEFHSQITIPTLLICAGGDQVVSCAAIEELGGRLRSGSCLTIDGAKHEILQERDVYREQLLSAFGSFVPGTELV